MFPWDLNAPNGHKPVHIWVDLLKYDDDRFKIKQTKPIIECCTYNDRATSMTRQ